MHVARLVWTIVVAIAIAIALLAVTWGALRDTGARTESLESDRMLADTRDGLVEYVTWGEGPPVMAIHGAGGGFDQGRLLARTMGGDGFRWLAVSRFGYLGSKLPDDPSTAAQAEAFVDLLDAQQIERVNILAMSGGVPPALKFAEMFPGRTGRMVLLASAPFTPFGPDVEDRPVPAWVYSALLGNDVFYWTLTKIARNMLADAFDARAELRRELASSEQHFVNALIDTFLPASGRTAGIENEAAAVDPGARYDLESIVAPVLVVHAKDDRINPFDIGVAIAGRIDGAEFMALETGGHLLLGHHAELRGKVREFLVSAPVDP